MSVDLGKRLFERFRKVPDSSIYEEIRHSEHWDTMLADPWIHPENERITALDREGLIKGYMGNRWEDFETAFQDAVFQDGKLFVHRCVTVNDPVFLAEELSRGRLPKGYNGLGIFWTWDYRAAKCYWGDDEGGRYNPVVMTGLVDLKGIDIEGTVLANFHPEVGEVEKEIRLKDGAAVWLTDLSRDETWPFKRFDPPVKLMA